MDDRSHCCYFSSVVTLLLSLHSSTGSLTQLLRYVRTVYQHKTNNAVSFMVRDILCLADPYIRIYTRPLVTNDNTTTAEDPPYTWLPISRAMLHPGAYGKLQDSILYLIAMEQDRQELAPAHTLLNRMFQRDFYKFAGSEVLQVNCEPAHADIWKLSEDDIIEGLLRTSNNTSPQLTAADIRIHKCEIHHGQKDRDPLQHMRFVDKAQLDKLFDTLDYQQLPHATPAKQEDYASRLPRTLMERSLRVYCTTKDKLELVEKAFDAWWEHVNAQAPSVTEVPPPAQCSQDESDFEEQASSPIASWQRTSVSPVRRGGGNQDW